MLKIRDYKNYWLKYKTSIPEIDEILIVSSEGELSKRISLLKKAKYILAVVVPSIDVNARDTDSPWYNYSASFFMLTPVANSNQTEDSFIDNIDENGEHVQTILNTINTDVSSGSCSLFHDIDFGSIKIDPEVNFLGCNGYSISFNFKYPM